MGIAVGAVSIQDAMSGDDETDENLLDLTLLKLLHLHPLPILRLSRISLLRSLSVQCDPCCIFVNDGASGAGSCSVKLFFEPQ